jgi:hypothetical protein
VRTELEIYLNRFVHLQAFKDFALVVFGILPLTVLVETIADPDVLEDFEREWFATDRLDSLRMVPEEVVFDVLVKDFREVLTVAQVIE